MQEAFRPVSILILIIRNWCQTSQLLFGPILEQPETNPATFGYEQRSHERNELWVIISRGHLSKQTLN